MKLEPSCRVILPGVDALTRNEQGNFIRLKFPDHLCQVRQRSAKPVQLVGDDQVDFLAPDQFHQAIQSPSGEGHSADRVLDLLDNSPTVALAIPA